MRQRRRTTYWLCWSALAVLLAGCAPAAQPYVRLSEGDQSVPTAAPGEPQKLPLRVA